MRELHRLVNLFIFQVCNVSHVLGDTALEINPPGNEKKEKKKIQTHFLSIFSFFEEKVISCLKFPELLVSTSFCHHFSISSQVDLFLPSVKITWFSLSENQKHKQFFYFFARMLGTGKYPIKNPNKNIHYEIWERNKLAF